MILHSVMYDENEELDTITITVSVREAAAIHAIGGKLNDSGMRRLGLTDGDSLYDVFTRVFNGHWDDGQPPTYPIIPPAVGAALNGSDL